MSPLIAFVLNGKLLKMADDILHHGVLLVAVLAAQVVQPRHLVEDVVDDGNKDGHTKRVEPDHHHGDNVGPPVGALLEAVGRDDNHGLAREPSEQTEHGGDDVDAQNGAHQLPRRPRLASARDKDEPVLGERDLQEEDALDCAEVLHDASAGEVHGASQDPRAGGQENAEKDAHDPDLGQLPLHGPRLPVRVVVCHGDGGQIGEQGKEDDEVDPDRLVDDDHGGRQVDLEVQAQRDAVLDVGLHALEDLPRRLDGRDDGAEAGGEEDNVGRRLGRLRRALDGDAAVGLLERGRVVDAIAGHGGEMAALLQHLDDGVLVLGVDLGEAVGALDKVVLDAAGEPAVDELLRVVDLGAEGQHLARLLGDGDGVAGEHLDGHAQVRGLDDGLGRVLARGVEHGQQAEQDPVAVVLLATPRERNPRRANSCAFSLYRLAVSSEQLVSLRMARGAPLAQVKRSLPRRQTLVMRLDTGSKGVNFSLTHPCCRISRAPGYRLSVRMVTLSMGSSDLRLCEDARTATAIIQSSSSPSDTKGSRMLSLFAVSVPVLSEQRMSTPCLLHNGLLLGEIGRADGQGRRRDDGETDGHADDEQDEGIVQQVLRAGHRDAQVVEEAADPGGQDPEHDEDQQRGADVVHDGLEVALVLRALDELGGAPDKGVPGRVDDDGVRLAALAARRVVDDVAEVLVDGQGLARDGRLVNGDERRAAVVLGGLRDHRRAPVALVLVLVGVGLVADVSQAVLGAEAQVYLKVIRAVVVADEPRIGGHRVALLHQDLGLRLAREDALLLAVADDGAPHRNVALEAGDDVGGLLLLVKADKGVEKQDAHDDSKVDPVTQAEGEESGNLHDYSVEKRQGHGQDSKPYTFLRSSTSEALMPVWMSVLSHASGTVVASCSGAASAGSMELFQNCHHRFLRRLLPASSSSRPASSRYVLM
ncbi:LOW QUALITY PROTEIN: fungal specific transcription factor [Purpureocillium lavendulum]|uniref:Fungal specific transcription factor n=1 Tax=Purpureocillium lavendulum TaxID=1247861 RepID=A0AB34FMC3_9HYPO|nr:LOW QUALITY PROTEIN: fungal specific transcription factor [Purpureocillium lavendulum]